MILPIILKNVPRRLQITLSFFLATISFGFLGPSEHIFRLPSKNIVYTIIGLLLDGLFLPMSFYPCLPEIID